MSFMESYIQNINDLKEILVEDCIRQSLKEDGNTVFIDQEEMDDGLRSSYFLNDANHSFCKIEYTSKGIYFYERRK